MFGGGPPVKYANPPPEFDGFWHPIPVPGYSGAPIEPIVPAAPAAPATPATSAKPVAPADFDTGTLLGE